MWLNIVGPTYIIQYIVHIVISKLAIDMGWLVINGNNITNAIVEANLISLTFLHLPKRSIKVFLPRCAIHRWLQLFGFFFVTFLLFSSFFCLVCFSVLLFAFFFFLFFLGYSFRLPLYLLLIVDRFCTDFCGPPTSSAPWLLLLPSKSSRSVKGYFEDYVLARVNCYALAYMAISSIFYVFISLCSPLLRGPSFFW